MEEENASKVDAKMTTTNIGTLTTT